MILSVSLTTNAYICKQRVLYFKIKPMKIKIYVLKMLTKWELFQFMSDTLVIADIHQEGKPQAYANKLSKLHGFFEIFDEELVQERLPTPHQLLQADKERDYAIRKIYQLIGYYSDYRYDAAKEQAAKGLKSVFKSYGTGSAISRLSQDTQTAVIGRLLQELARDKEQQYIATLGLTEAVLALATSNKVFDKEQRSRRKLQSEYVTGIVRDARTELQNEFMEFVALINALAVIEGPEKYVVLKKTIHAMIQKYVAAVRQRTKKKDAEE